MNLLLAVLFTIAPFIAGSIAALGARHDLRMLWMALAATVVARLATATLLRGGRRRVVVSSVGFVAATVAASVVAVAFGARAVFGVVAVAVVLAGCATAGAVLGTAARPASD
jgi:hypothetical protein